MSDITKKSRVLTSDDLVSMIEEAVKKLSHNKPDIETLRKKQEKAILKRELGQEKREKINTLAKKGASTSKQIQVLGSDTLTPLQIAKFHSNRPDIEDEIPRISFTQKILGNKPSPLELNRYTLVTEILRTADIDSNNQGEILINDNVISGSNLIRALRYIIKGKRGFKNQPLGVIELANILKEGGISSSKFPESVRNILGGKKGRKGRYLTADETLDETFDETLYSDNSDSEEQSGEGLEHLRNACDHVEAGNHNKAWSSLHKTRMLKVDCNKLKQVENYLDLFR